jgi:hypothetical protein
VCDNYGYHTEEVIRLWSTTMRKTVCSESFGSIATSRRPSQIGGGHRGSSATPLQIGGGLDSADLFDTAQPLQGRALGHKIGHFSNIRPSPNRRSQTTHDALPRFVTISESSIDLPFHLDATS